MTRRFSSNHQTHSSRPRPLVLLHTSAILVILIVSLPHPAHLYPTPGDDESSPSTTAKNPNNETSEPPSSSVRSTRNSDDSDYPDDFSPPPLVILPDDSDHGGGDSGSSSSSSSGGGSRGPPSPADLEARRVAFIKALGGGGGGEGGGGGGGLLSLQGLGSLATDVVTLLTSNSNETFAPLREATQRARQNFPDFGTTLSRTLAGSREYGLRAYRGLAKNLRVKATNALRFMLQALTRLGSTLGGLYNVLISILDVVTRALTTGARAGSRLLASGSNATFFALARGSSAIRNAAQSGLLRKPITEALNVGRGFAKGVSEDLFNKVEWAQEGISSKLELAQALAPNFLLNAHTRTTPISSHEPPSISCCGGGGEYEDGAGSASFIPLSASASEKMEEEKRDGRGVDNDEVVMRMMEMLRDESKVNETDTRTTPATNSSSSAAATTAKPGSIRTTTSRKPDQPPQELLNDIFGLESEMMDNVNGNSGNATSATTSTTTSTTEKPDTS